MRFRLVALSLLATSAWAGRGTLEVSAPSAQARTVARALRRSLAESGNAAPSGGIAVYVAGTRRLRVTLLVRSATEQIAPLALHYDVANAKRLGTVPRWVTVRIAPVLAARRRAVDEDPATHAGDSAAATSRADPHASAKAGGAVLEPPASSVADSGAASADRESSADTRAESEPEGVEEEPVWKESGAVAKSPWLAAAVGGRVLSRQFGYVDDLFHALPSYRLPAAPAVAFDLEWAPLWQARPALLSNLSIVGGGEWAVGLASASASSHFSTSEKAVRGELRERVPLGRFELLPGFGYAWQAFTVGTASTPVAGLPNVAYAGPRAEVAARFELSSWVTFDALAGCQPAVTSGQMTSTGWFPHARSGEVDGGAGLTLSQSNLRFRAGVDYRRYFHSLNPSPGDPLIAGGALDEFVTVTLSVGWAYAR